MANQSSLVFAGIAPHPPIMVPEVGKEAISEVTSSIEAMAEFTSRVVQTQAETVIIISPHAPLELDVFVAYSGPHLYGDFANFRAPETSVSTEVDEDLLEGIKRQSAANGYGISSLTDYRLDHGTAVPLYFLMRNGWHGKVVALGYSFLSNQDHLKFGQCIRQAIDELGRSVAFVASGDLSHRLKPDAPAGYNPGAYAFDQRVVEAIDANEPQGIVEIDPELRKIAGECGYRSMLVALGVTSELTTNCEVLSYEAPFGVGYLVAQITGATNVRKAEDELPALAREAVETFTRRHLEIEPHEPLSELLRTRAPCFVSLKTSDGDLRGCIGTIEPSKPTLAEEIIANAIMAATRDPRFAEVTEEELENLRYSVDVLMPAEPAEMKDLDPRVYGVIVEDKDGRRGLLLPDIPGVDDSEHQVAIAARKAGIAPDTEVRLSRFKVQRFKE